MKKKSTRSQILFLKSILLVVFIFSQYISFGQVTFTDSNLPIVIINTDNAEEIPDDPRIFGDMKIIYRGEGLQNYITDQTNPAFLNYNGRIDIELRGSSSQDLPKKQYGLTTKLTDNLSNNNVSLLGMPSENDWILNGLAFDPSLIRDYLSYNLSRMIGNYATRTVYCELVINGEYKGLYILQEKIKADGERVNVTKITTTQNTFPNVSGGYITKADKTTGGDPVAWTMSSYIDGDNINFIHELPKPTDVTTQQNDYIYGQFNNLKNTTAVGNSSLSDGFPSIIDIPSFIDFMISNEIASNADGYQLSTYFHKDRNGKLRAGPIWDFNLTYGNDLFDYGFDRSHYDVWQFANGDNQGPKFWTDLFNNPQFKCYLAKRWNELIQPGQPMNINSLNTYIDNTISYISAAAVRENEKWGTVPALEFEIIGLKSFLSNRITWITDHLGSFADCSNVVTPPLVISKINYNPNISATFTNSNDQEFIEIKNTGSQPVDVTGIYFKGTGFVFQFPANQIITPNSSVYLASKASVFQNRYGFAAFGEFTRNLSNSNQDLVLADGFGNIIDNVHFYDNSPWPNADGNGSFLQLTDTTLDNNLGASWTAINMDLLSNDEFSSNSFIQIFPNPTSSSVTIKANESISKVQIFDIQGRNVKSVDENSDTAAIEMDKFSNGVYLIKVFTANKFSLHKIIKQ